MGEDGYCADQTGPVCGDPVDDPLLDIRGMADTLVPKEKSTVAAQRKKTQLLARNPIEFKMPEKGETKAQGCAGACTPTDSKQSSSMQRAFNAEPYAHHFFEKTLGKKTQSGKVQ
jgi:hypothetical protein